MVCKILQLLVVTETLESIQVISGSEQQLWSLSYLGTCWLEDLLTFYNQFESTPLYGSWEESKIQEYIFLKTNNRLIENIIQELERTAYLRLN